MSLVCEQVVESYKQPTVCDEKKTLAHIQGFVSVSPFVELDEHGPRLNGLLVPGIVNRYKMVNRQIRLDARVPPWFKEAIDHQQKHISLGEINPELIPVPGLLHFRVRVTGWSASGKTVYVAPIAKSLEHAEKEWKRELDLLNKLPKSVEECDGATQLADFAYRTYAKQNNLTIVRREVTKPEYDNVVVVDPDGQTLSYLHGAKAIWLFTDGIVKGATTLEKEIQRYVQTTGISQPSRRY